jgi:opacity protein-like surface antigen
MKKLWTLVLFLCLFSAAQAQQFKFIAGPAVSHYSDEWPQDGVWLADSAFLNPFENHRIGFLAGCGVEFALSRRVSIEVDGLYFQKGSVFESTSLSFYSTRDVYVLSGFSVPWLLKLKLLPGPLPYFLGGLEFTYVTAHTKITSYRPEASLGWKELPKENLIDATHRFDLGPVVGLGLEAKLAKVFFFLEARYSLGLADLPVRRTTFRPDIRTSSLVILTGFKFD